MKSDLFLNQNSLKKIKEIDEMMSVGAPIAPIGGGSLNLKNKYGSKTAPKVKKKTKKNFDEILNQEINKLKEKD